MKKILVTTTAALMLVAMPGVAAASAKTHPDSTKHSDTSTTLSSKTSDTTHHGKEHKGRSVDNRGKDNKQNKDNKGKRDNKKNPTVMFVLHGTVGSFVAYTPATTTAPTSPAVNGSVTIKVTGSNLAKTELKGATLSFVIDGSTKVELHDHAAVAAGDKVIVKLRVPKGTDLATAEASTPAQSFTAFQVIDQGAHS